MEFKVPQVEEDSEGSELGCVVIWRRKEAVLDVALRKLQKTLEITTLSFLVSMQK